MNNMYFKNNKRCDTMWAVKVPRNNETKGVAERTWE